MQVVVEPTAGSPVEVCHHPRAQHVHGTYAAYRKDACRCGPCRDAKRVSLMTARRDRSGRCLPGERLAQRVTVLTSGAGKGAPESVAALAARSGVSSRVLRRLRDDPACRIRVATARKLAQVQPLPRRRVTPIGVQRRLRALMALGWTTGAIAADCGVTAEWIRQLVAGGRRGAPRPVSAAMADAVCRAYDDLWDQDPAERLSMAQVNTARGRAAAGHWVVPLAWDDTPDGDRFIDDPAAKPDRRVKSPRKMSIAEALVELDFLVDQGNPVEDGVTRLGLGSVRTLGQRAHRNGFTRWYLPNGEPRARVDVDELGRGECWEDAA